MDCTICGKSTLPGAMLCAPCKAALKRARYVTVQEDIRRPSVIDVRRQSRRARAYAASRETVPDAPLPAAPDALVRLRRRIFIGIFVLAAALGGASYFGQRDLGARAHDETSTAPPTAPEIRQDVAASGAGSGKAETPAMSSAADSDRAAFTGSEPSPHTLLANKPAGTATVKRTMLAGRATAATANGDPPEAVVTPPPPEIIAAAPPPPPRPVPDRWQNMRDALVQCDSEGVIGGLICGQRVRIQYCEGYWGKVAQCPGAAATYER
jgi:hypothetical protein